MSEFLKADEVQEMGLRQGRGAYERWLMQNVMDYLSAAQTGGPGNPDRFNHNVPQDRCQSMLGMVMCQRDNGHGGEVDKDKRPVDFEHQHLGPFNTWTVWI